MIHCRLHPSLPSAVAAALIALPTSAQSPAPAGDSPQEADAVDLPVAPPVDAALSWADWSGDGLLDAWASQPDGTGVLLENLGDGSFADRTAAAGLSDVAGVHQAAWADVDGDGRLDLYLASWTGASRLALQASPGAFVDVTRASGLSPHARPVTATWVDYDRDGLSDLHLVTLRGDVVYRGRGRARFEQVDLGLVPRAGLSGAAPRSNASGLGGGNPNTTSSRVPNASAAGGGGSICAGSIEDFGGGGCMTASSTPMLGMLYPLSNDFFVDGTGRVGIGTTSPTARLSVNGRMTADRIQSTVGNGTSPLIVNSSTRVTNLNADELDGFDATDFRLQSDPIDGGDIQNGSIGTADITDGSITSADIADGTITGIDVQDGSILGVDIGPNTISAANLGNNSVGNSEIAPGAVTSTEIATGTIVNSDVAPNAAIDGTKVDPDFGSQTVIAVGVDASSSSTSGAARVRGDLSSLSTTAGYLGAAGGTDFDGVASADWAGFEIGVAGISTGVSQSDNYGVLGHSNNAGVRGENSAAPLLDFAELGLPGIGLRAAGTASAAEFDGKVEIDHFSTGLRVITSGSNADAMVVDNQSAGPAARFISSTVGSSDIDPCVTANTQSRGQALLMIQSNPSATIAGAEIRSFGTSSNHTGFLSSKTSQTAGSAGRFRLSSSFATGNALIVENSGSGVGIDITATDRGVRATSTNGRAVDANKSGNSGDILVARNGTDIEFRANSTGDAFCDGAFVGGGADYAEWLPVLDPTETFQKGDVVGVHGGKISKRLADADVLLVISTNPCLVGNNVDAEQEDRDDHQIVAFLGQVPVRVRGPVRAGDLLVPSGMGDGTAMAVDPGDLAPSQLADVIGRAWESSVSGDVHRVTTAIGLERDRIAALALEAVQDEVAELRSTLQSVVARIDQLEQR